MLIALKAVVFFVALFATFNFVAAVVSFHAQANARTHGKAETPHLSFLFWLAPSCFWTVFYLLYQL